MTESNTAAVNDIGRARLLLGDTFLAYVLDLDTEDSSPLAEKLASRPRGSEILDSLVRVVHSSRTENESEARYRVGQLLGQYTEGSRKTLAAQMRDHVTGRHVDVIPTRDPVFDLLALEAVSVYPLFLLPLQQPMDVLLTVTTALHQSPNRDRLEREILADESLRQMFPGDSAKESSGSQSYMVSPSHAGSFDLTDVSETILTSSWSLACLTVLVPSLDDLISALKRCIEMARRVASGEMIQVPSRVGIFGPIPPPQFESTSIAAGVLRSLDSRDKQFLEMAGLTGESNYADETGHAASFRIAGDLVLELETSYRAEFHEVEDLSDFDTPWLSDMEHHYKSESDATDRVRLALALVDPQKPIAARTSWHWNFDLLSRGSQISWSRPELSSVIPTRLAPDQLAQWFSLGNLCESEFKDRAKFGVSVRRALSAMSLRADPDDILIDSVIVWENLFGTSSETVNRVCTSMALLLADDFEDRRRILTACKKLYDLRSKVVHGASSDVPYEKSQEALSFALRTIRELLENRPGLLRSRTSELRSQEIFLRN
jgi:hypothetical protein